MNTLDCHNPNCQMRDTSVPQRNGRCVFCEHVVTKTTTRASGPTLGYYAAVVDAQSISWVLAPENEPKGPFHIYDATDKNNVRLLTTPNACQTLQHVKNFIANFGMFSHLYCVTNNHEFSRIIQL